MEKIGAQLIVEMSIIGDETMLLKTGDVGGADTFLSNTHLREAEFASKKSIKNLETNHFCRTSRNRKHIGAIFCVDFFGDSNIDF